MSSGIRKNLYLSASKDTDILNYIEPLLKHYDFSSVIRELVRDGIKFRSGAPGIVTQSHTPAPTSQVIIPKKEKSDKELFDYFDNL